MKGFYLFRVPAAYTIFLAGLALALFAPVDVLDRAPFLRTFTDSLGTIFPPIRNYVARSEFPQLTQLYFSVMWLLSPLTFYWIGKDLSDEANPEIAKWRNGKAVESVGSAVGFAMLVIGILPVLVVYLWFFNEGEEFSWLRISSSRIALGFGGYFLAGTVGWWMLQAEVQLVRKAYRQFVGKQLAE